MRKVNKEATLRDVLAEVSLVDLGALMKTAFSTLGCVAVLFVPIIFLGEFAKSETNGKPWFGLPDWVSYLFIAWVFIGSYTADKSYYEHHFAFYLPKAGFLWSIPIAAYLVLGFNALPSYQPDLALSQRLMNGAIYMAWWMPIVISFAIFEVGHGKLIEKRERETNELSRQSGGAGQTRFREPLGE